MFMFITEIFKGTSVGLVPQNKQS